MYVQLYFAIPRVLGNFVVLTVVNWWCSGKSPLLSEFHWLVFVLVFYLCQKRLPQTSGLKQQEVILQFCKLDSLTQVCVPFRGL